MKYKKGQLISFRDWRSPISTHYLKSIEHRELRKENSLFAGDMGVIVDCIPLAIAWAKMSYNKRPKNCYIVVWQKSGRKRLMYENEISRIST